MRYISDEEVNTIENITVLIREHLTKNGIDWKNNSTFDHLGISVSNPLEMLFTVIQINERREISIAPSIVNGTIEVYGLPQYNVTSFQLSDPNCVDNIIEEIKCQMI